VVAASFTDEQVRVIDFRIGPSTTQDIGNATMQLEHSDLIKKVQLSPDGTLLVTTGQDGTVKLWDLGLRRCVQTIGPELTGQARKTSSFHQDSITCLDVNFEEDLFFTGGRDGSIFMSSSGTTKTAPYQRMYQSSQMITCLKYDDRHGKLWYGTPQSGLDCLQLAVDSASPHMYIKGKTNLAHSLKKGLPWITDYHVLRNKMYILTNQVDGKNADVKLWSIESGEVIKTYPS